MPLDTWLSFIAVVTVFALIPGPTVILVVGQAIVNGRRAVLPLAAGVVAGDFVAMSLSLIGLGAVLAASATLFAILKWFGVIYLVYLGIKSWKTESAGISDTPDITAYKSWRSLFKSSFLVTALNPKDIVFFVAFLPQFVDASLPAGPQFGILMVTFLVIVSITITSFAFFAGVVRNQVKSNRAQKHLNRVGGSALIGAGAFASTVDRS